MLTRADVAYRLWNIADIIDGWALESLSGGWSKHQVDANRKVAMECRVLAGTLLVHEQRESKAS